MVAPVCCNSSGIFKDANTIFFLRAGVRSNDCQNRFVTMKFLPVLIALSGLLAVGFRYQPAITSQFACADSLPLPDEHRFTREVLVEKLDEPMELAVTSGGKIFFIERKGRLKLYDPALKTTVVAGRLNVYGENEDGLLGLALDPAFDRNGWMYLYYAPAGPKSINRLSRFTIKADRLDPRSEKIMLEVPVVRACCHSGGSLAFGPGGNLFLSLGDDTNPFESSGFGPFDERPGRWDAQKTSANTNDLRGKILRIHPEPDGSYSIPDGNLFPKGMAGTRPEIYVMGNRNPFRISVDQHNGFLYWGEVGPDAGTDSAHRGPKGHDEVNQARKAGFFGWPYFVGNNKAYNDYDFATGKSGAPYDAAAPINNSPNNTGIRQLPPAQSAFIWYPYDESAEFPLVGKGGRNAMAGPVFYLSDFKNAPSHFPAYYDQKLLTYDWMRNWIMAITMDEQGNFKQMEPFMPGTQFDKPVDMQFGADGALYVLEYGTYWSAQNDDARLSRIEYNEGNRKPIVQAGADKQAGAAPLTVRFDTRGSFDYDKDDVLRYEWTFDQPGIVQSKEAAPVYTFTRPGTYKATVKALDKAGKWAQAQVRISVGNEPPKVAIETSGNRSFYWDDTRFRYAVKVTDREDGQLGRGIAAGKVQWRIGFVPEGKDVVQAVQGHQVAAAATLSPAKGKVLLEASDCKACHALDRNSVGPSFSAIANRYDAQPSVADKLAAKIINGGGGVWGDREMAAHPQISKGDAKQMVAYILSLRTKGKTTAPALPLSGTFAAREHAGKGGEGSYVLRALYTDRGANGMPSLKGADQITLRHPLVRAADCDELKDAARGNTGEVKIIKFTANGAYIRFGGIDLSGVQYLRLLVNPKNATGRIEVHASAADGPLLGATPVLSKKDMQPDQKGSWMEVAVPLSGAAGIKDLFLVFKEGPGVNIWNTFDLETVYFGAGNKEQARK